MTMIEVNEALEAMTRLSRYLMANASKGQLTNEQILSCKILLSEWTAGKTVETDDCVRYGEKVYRCRQDHTTQGDWTPDVTPAMWSVIDVVHVGTVDDPIPSVRGMEYIYGLHYLDPEDGLIYLCTRLDAVDGETVTLQYLPHEVVGQYFESIS